MSIKGGQPPRLAAWRNDFYTRRINRADRTPIRTEHQTESCMPIFEYRCVNCDHRFEQLVRSKRDEQCTCPKCDSKNTERLLSVFAAPTTTTVAPPMSGGCGRCGDPNGPCQS